MGIVSKLFTFVGGTTKTGEASQVNADFDTLYTLVNGNIDNANIAATANIQESKILNLATDLQARVLKAGDTMTGPLTLKQAFPLIRLIGTDSGNRDWRIVTSGSGSGKIFFERNDGTELAPVWVDLYSLPIGGTALAAIDLAAKGYVDTAVAATTTGMAFAETYKTDGNFVSAAGAGFNAVTGLFAEVNIQANHRIRVTYVGNVSNDSVTPEAVYTSLQVDFVNQGQANGLTTVYSDSDKPGNASFSFVTAQLSAGLHSCGIIQRSQVGNATMHCNTSHPAIVIAEELATGF